MRAIRNIKDHRVYWSNEFGWADWSSRTLFEDDEKVRLPQDGEWSQEDSGMIIVIVGNIMDGLEIYGPFEDMEDAREWAERRYTVDDWFACRITNPNNNTML